MKTNSSGRTTSAYRNPTCARKTTVKYQAKKRTGAARNHSFRRNNHEGPGSWRAATVSAAVFALAQLAKYTAAYLQGADRDAAPAGARDRCLRLVLPPLRLRKRQKAQTASAIIHAAQRSVVTRPPCARIAGSKT